MAPRRRLSPAVTLLEVLIIAALFAVVAGLAYRSSWKGAEKTRVRQAWSMLRLIDVAQRSYVKDTGNFAASLADLINDGYIDDPSVGQSDWTYLVEDGNRRVRARRTAGSCTGKLLWRYYAGLTAGKEEQTLPSCP